MTGHQRHSRHDRIAQLRRELQEGRSSSLKRRRAIIACSMVGMASMAAVSAFQAGLLRRLPDPPVDRFRSEEVNSSDTAYQYGVPDGTISLAGHATNIVLAGYGGASRVHSHPWVPIAASLKAGAEALVAVKYLFYEMPIVQKKWCGYCIVDAVMHIGTFALTVPETIGVFSTHRRQAEGAPPLDE